MSLTKLYTTPEMIDLARYYDLGDGAFVALRAPVSAIRADNPHWEPPAYQGRIADRAIVWRLSEDYVYF